VSQGLFLRRGHPLSGVPVLQKSLAIIVLDVVFELVVSLLTTFRFSGIL